MSSVLVANVGNTTTELALFDGSEIVQRFVSASSRERTVDELTSWLAPWVASNPDSFGSARGVLSSVVPGLTRVYATWLANTTGRVPLEVCGNSVQGLKVDVPDPQSVGPDRIANCIAVAHRYRLPAIVVDMGTATNFEVVQPGPRFIGGMIAPGVGLAAEALFARASRLAAVEIEAPGNCIGRDTRACLQSGMFYGAVAQVDGLVARIRREMGGRPTVVATGGWAARIGPECRTIRHIDPDLTLHGLRLLAN